MLGAAMLSSGLAPPVRLAGYCYHLKRGGDRGQREGDHDGAAGGVRAEHLRQLHHVVVGGLVAVLRVALEAVFQHGRGLALIAIQRDGR